ncbi:MAG: glycoside hydrolase family 2 TIM barrel-domain containing protein [Clostridia bacterium]
MEINLKCGWQVLQDHYDLGEAYALYADQYDPTIISADYPGGAPFQLDEWRDVPILLHLQNVLSEDAQYGPELRLYNQSPWWYRLRFDLTETQVKQNACLCFDGVDYFCKVYLNGQYLGKHEGYQTPFLFELGDLLQAHNVLYVKVWSPLAFNRAGGPDDPRFLMVIRDMMKGTCEHGDSLLHRDRNPVGIWRDVRLVLYDQLHLDNCAQIDARMDGEVIVTARIYNANTPCSADVQLDIFEFTSGKRVFQKKTLLPLPIGESVQSLSGFVQDPRFWSTWDRDGAWLYEAILSIGEIHAQETFGFRQVELRRNEQETTYYLNGERIYMRGVSYFPDAYLSMMHEGRYLRDLEIAKRMGCNMIRVHVHQAMPVFYKLCDEMGLAVMQDTDFNWMHPCDEMWTERACELFREQITTLYNHPAILTWVCMNEPIEPFEPDMGRYAQCNRFVYQQPGPQLLALGKKLDKQRTFIRASYCENDLESGDSHNYTGSIDGPIPYTVREQLPPEKFNTEFGVDAPPNPASLWRERRLYLRLGDAAHQIESIQQYQYRFLKYCIEGYRLRKYAPTAGHLQFMLIDCSPASHYGAIDYWGCAKPSIRAFLESNQPLGVFYQHSNDGSDALWVVNDFSEVFPNCVVRWTITDETHAPITSGEKTINLLADDLVKVESLVYAHSEAHRYKALLYVEAANGRILTQNTYEDLFHHPTHPEGHPAHFSHTWGIRLYNGGGNVR